ncbi:MULTISPECIES: DUF815 domain-containing protein [Leptospirillum]|jgi:predicted AAA+ superfamily ATPase|uniref:Uncharacterized protein n=3 Tax=Leptospirillum ferriphilum TaxID=178606 RepID=A0A059XXQ5_9BACT|nr:MULTISPECIES: DUF815 domain-containing protein [Leptospirillum]EAY56800.1 MAG: probable AAA ATPase superfamily [Leptospirillum rubarum]EIJ76723.1 MAG: putative AAA ATPase superfamily [Leptospirillum sp. Group II 'C75']AFS54091.1 putative AAA+ superfamily ATPase [Leptospirillum ferriphilum ML-04]AIA31890.1 hypothetical protein Y981_09615 [Leptospirillum ferriphilum YSK]AKS23996.1 hypothetical protein ABH19_10005 [Leptospirillum sp. Group II 'CF-1']
MDPSSLFRNALEMEVDAFRVLSGERDSPSLFPVRHPRSAPREGLIGLASTLSTLQKNLDSFEATLSPVSTLVHGFRGTGKTSMVLEAWRETNRKHAHKKIPRCRLIQVDREGIPYLLPLIDVFSDRREYFLLFFDDLYFPAEDPHFHQFRAFLDGGIAMLPENTGLVVTSNHRHLVSESFSRREDALNPGETRDDSLALWDRFGLSLSMTEPSLETYLEIVIAKCIDRNILPAGTRRPEIRIDETPGRAPLSAPSRSLEGIVERARRFALLRASRSGRTAQWFVDLLERGILDIQEKEDA